MVEFTDWDNEASYDRLGGLDDNTEEILALKVPKILLPLSAGRNMAVIVEVAARNHLLKIMGGYDSAKAFSEKLLATMNPSAALERTNTKDNSIIRRKSVE